MQTREQRLFRDVAGLALFLGATAAVALSGARVSPGRSNRARRWYRRLEKSPYQPPPQVFGQVWSLLYPALAVSAHRAWRARPSANRSQALRWWSIQLGLNGLWSPLFFGARKPRAALADSALLLSSAANYARYAARVDKTAAVIVLPYLAWLGFATVLNAEIVRRN